MEHVTAQGEEVPALGLGTWRLEGEECRTSVGMALAMGYRHLDTAQAYGNEEAVGTALAAADVDRGEVFLTTKVWNDQTTAEAVVASAEESLRKLRAEYVDLLLLHWPADEATIPARLEGLVRARERGLTRLVGVSNFTPSLVDLAREHAPVFCNQVEHHPYLGQQHLVEQARAHDLLLAAYSPIARGRVLDDETLREIAAAHGKSPVQVTLRWLLDQPQVCAIPKATSREHLEANLGIFDFALSDEERERIDGLDRGDRLIDPGFGPAWERPADAGATT